MKHKFLKSILICTTLAIGTMVMSPLETNIIQTVEAKSNIKLNVKSKSIYKGKTYTLKVQGTKKKVKWSSSNKKVATVNSKGKVTAKKKGSCYIYAKVSGKKLKCKITVKNKPSSYVSNLTFGKTYKNFDITGDKKNDTIKLYKHKITGYDEFYNYDKVIVYVNGKQKILSVKNGKSLSMEAKLIKLNNKIFLLINGYAENYCDNWQVLYQYKNSKFVKAYDFKNITSKYGYAPHTSIAKVSENKIYVEHSLISDSLGCVNFQYIYQYKNEKVSRTSNTANVSWEGFNDDYQSVKYGTMAVNKTMYTSPTSHKKKGVIKKGTKVKPTKIYMTGSQIYIQLKTKSGKTGWVKGVKGIHSNPLIKESLFVG